jgi:exopolysaccharide biosynthesis polyprenyl glycosylphosphotransferase
MPYIDYRPYVEFALKEHIAKHGCPENNESWAPFIKRIEDLIIVIPALIILLPFIIFIAILIKATSSGPVFFRQERVGLHNTLFKCIKFRTMYMHLADFGAKQQTRKNDPRVTKLGSFLRRTSLDELPQLFNVLVGHMSLVGPRPHALETKAGGIALGDAVSDYYSRHHVRPGITGWAQVNGCRGELDSVAKIIKRVEYDLEYIDNWSIGFDLEIMLKTIKLVIHDDNAY